MGTQAQWLRQFRQDYKSASRRNPSRGEWVDLDARALKFAKQGQCPGQVARFMAGGQKRRKNPPPAWHQRQLHKYQRELAEATPEDLGFASGRLSAERTARGFYEGGGVDRNPGRGRRGIFSAEAAREAAQGNADYFGVPFVVFTDTSGNWRSERLTSFSPGAPALKDAEIFRPRRRGADRNPASRYPALAAERILEHKYPNLWAVRPAGKLGTCGWMDDGRGWEVAYVRARSVGDAIAKAGDRVWHPGRYTPKFFRNPLMMVMENPGEDREAQIDFIEGKNSWVIEGLWPAHVSARVLGFAKTKEQALEFARKLGYRVTYINHERVTRNPIGPREQQNARQLVTGAVGIGLLKGIAGAAGAKMLTAVANPAQYRPPIKVRDFGRWHWVVFRYCPACGQEIRLRAGDTRRGPSLPPGAIRCPRCEAQVSL